MASCNDCIHNEICQQIDGPFNIIDADMNCADFKLRSRFVELHHAEWVEDEDVCGVPIFRCSNCDERFVLEEGTPFDNCYFYCIYAKFDFCSFAKTVCMNFFN